MKPWKLLICLLRSLGKLRKNNALEDSGQSVGQTLYVCLGPLRNTTEGLQNRLKRKQTNLFSYIDPALVLGNKVGDFLISLWALFSMILNSQMHPQGDSLPVDFWIAKNVIKYNCGRTYTCLNSLLQVNIQLNLSLQYPTGFLICWLTQDEGRRVLLNTWLHPWQWENYIDKHQDC